MVTNMLIRSLRLQAVVLTLTLNLNLTLTRAQSPEVVVQTGHSSQIFHLAYSEDARRMLSASSDNTVNVWDVATGMAIQSIQGHGAVITAAAYSADGAAIAIAAADDHSESIAIWKLLGDAPERLLLFSDAPGAKKPPKGVQDLDFSPDGKHLVARTNTRMKVYEVRTGKLMADVELKKAAVNLAKNYNNAIARFGPDGQTVYANHFPEKLSGPYVGSWNLDGTSAGEFPLFAKKSRSLPGLNSIKVPKIKVPSTRSVDVSPLSWFVISPDGSHLAYLTGGAVKIDIEIWDLVAGKRLQTLRPSGKFGKIADKLITKAASGDRSRFSIPLAFSPDNQFVAVGAGGKVMVYELASGKQVQSVHYAMMGKLLRDKLRDPKGKTRLNFEGYSSLAFHPGTSVLAGGGGNLSGVASADGKKAIQLITVWNLETGREVRRLTGQYNEVEALAFGPGDRYLVSGGNRMHYWDLHLGQLRRRAARRGGVRAVDASRSGRVLVAAQRGTVGVYDFDSGQRLRSIQTLDNPATNMPALSPDGSLLAFDGSIYAVGEKNQTQAVSGADPGNVHSHPVFSDAGKQVGFGGKRYVLADAASGAVAAKLSGDAFFVPGFRPDGAARAARVDAEGIVVLDPSSKTEIQRLEMPTESWNADLFGRNGQLAFSPGASYLAVAKSKSLRNAWVWNTATGALAGNLQGHARNISGAAFSSDNSLIATASSGAEIKLWKLPSCEPVATMIPVDSSDFIITTPDNYYMASKGALGQVAFRIGTQAFPFEQFDLQLNRPDIVLQRIGQAPPELIAAYKKAHAKRLKRLNFTPEMLGDDFHLPEIAITTEKLPVTSYNRALSFSVKATDSKYMLDRIRVYVNDVPLHGRNGLDLRSQAASTWTGEISLDLSAGLNEIQVSCMNAKGVESLRETFVITYETESPKPTLYLVAIGVSEYADTRFNLNYAAKDAQDFAKLMKSRMELYETVVARQLTNAEVTTEGLAALREVLQQSKVDDQVVVFVAGHGVLDADFNYYFGAHDMDFDRPAAKGIAYAELESLLDGIKARKKLLIMDTCHSGEVDKESVEVADGSRVEVGAVKFRSAGVGVRKTAFGLENSFELMKFLFADLRRGTGATVISSAGGAEYALEGDEWNNGVFTYCLLSGMQDLAADADGDGKVMLSELQAYATAKVGELTGGKQVPTSRVENLTNDFRVW